MALIGIICPLEFSFPLYFSIHCFLLIGHVLYEGIYWRYRGPAGYTTLPLTFFAAICFTIIPEFHKSRYFVISVLLTVTEDVLCLIFLTKYYFLIAIIHIITFCIYLGRFIVPMCVYWWNE